MFQTTLNIAVFIAVLKVWITQNKRFIPAFYWMKLFQIAKYIKAFVMCVTSKDNKDHLHSISIVES